MVAKLSDGYTQYVVTLVSGQFKISKILIPYGGFVGIRELVIGIVVDPIVSHLDTVSRGSQSRDRRCSQSQYQDEAEYG